MTAEINRRSILQAIGLGGGAALLAGCGGAAPTQTGGSTSAGISFQDQQGKTITFDRPVARVVTIPMPAASLLVAVDGGADHLAAMHNASWVAMRDGILGKIFPQALELPHDVATQDFMPNVESVRALNPDVVIQWSDAQLVAPLENAGLKVVGLVNNGQQEDVDAWIAMFSAMLGKPERATEIKEHSDRELAEVKQLAAGRNAPGPSILYFNRFEGGLKVAAANTYNDFYIKLIGGSNPATGEDALPGTGMVGLDVEQALSWDLEVILLGNFDGALPQDVYSDPVWKNVAAVRSRRVYKVPLGGYRWDPPGQESPLMWHWLSDIAFPQQQSRLLGKTADYYRMLYNYRLTAADFNRILWAEENRESADYQQFNVG